MLNSKLRNCSIDLAGELCNHPNYLQIRARINHLTSKYVSLGMLYSNLHDLPTQFTEPHQRHWEKIDWKKVNINQIIGVEPAFFINLIAGAAEVEAPIRDYARESRDYLQVQYPAMASFMAGNLASDGQIIELGIWGKEERQHLPVFKKIYQQLTGEKLQPKANTVNGYQPTGNLQRDMYYHTLSRITTQWSATSIYLWLMAHPTGELQQAIAQPLQDEVNHLAKFWGFGAWAFGDAYFSRLYGAGKHLIALAKHNKQERSQSDDVLKYSSALHAVELAFTFARVRVQLGKWNKTLNSSYLNHLFDDTAKCQVSQH
ncbi:MAG: hypothetical protein H0X31_16415 [Nostocaceae cyanobacterium]|nr:hypothetical protein [Nostocaceae cyanobacterium]